MRPPDGAVKRMVTSGIDVRCDGGTLRGALRSGGACKTRLAACGRRRSGNLGCCVNCVGGAFKAIIQVIVVQRRHSGGVQCRGDPAPNAFRRKAVCGRRHPPGGGAGASSGDGYCLEAGAQVGRAVGAHGGAAVAAQQPLRLHRHLLRVCH